MMPRADLTRATLLDAALVAFARRGVRATTLEHVAASAEFTRGAVYWHFPNKTALVTAVFEDVVWPFDIGAPDAIAPQAENVLGRLREVLVQKMRECLADPRQRSMMRVVVRYRGTPELPEALNTRLEQMYLRALERLSAVLGIASKRGELRRGLAPIDVAQCLAAACIGVIAEHMRDSQTTLDSAFCWAPELILLGASAAPQGIVPRAL